MDNSTRSSDISQENLTAIQGKNITWKTLLLSILGGYVCVILFFILARYLLPIFLFAPPMEYQPKFQEALYLWSAAFFLILYTIYQVNKIIWFSLRKNRFFSSVYGSIRRFLVSYVWCLYIGIIPFCFWDPHNFGLFSGPTRRLLESNGFWSVNTLLMIVADIGLMSMVVSLYSIALILAQRFIVTCYLALMNKPMGKQEENVRFWQSTETSTLITRQAAIRYCIDRLGEVCYWLAMNILAVACIVAWFLLPILIESNSRQPGGGSGGGFALIAVESVFWVWFRIAFCYLVFSIIVRSLFRAIRWRVHLYASRQV